VIGDVVIVPFPFSDLSDTKRRPAAVIAQAEHGDVILCQITSRPWSSTHAIRLDEHDILGEGLSRVSYARTDKLFTASASLAIRTMGRIDPTRLSELRRAARELFD
jgi:mRNA interferase MazF